MPPITQPQGSRGGLITALVVFAILFLTAAIFAIYYNVNMRAEQDKFAKLETKYKGVIADSDLVGESDVQTTVRDLRERFPELADTNLKLVNVLQVRGDRLAKVIAGDSARAGLAAETQAASSVTAVNEKLRGNKNLQGVVVNPDNLLGSVDSLAKALISKDQQLVAANNSIAKKFADNANEVSISKARLEEIEQKVATANAEAEKARTDAAKDRSEKQAQLDALSAEVKKVSDELNKAVQDKQLEVTAALGKITKLQQDLERLQVKLGQYRMNTTESGVRRPDGVISEVAKGNTVYINIGQGQQVTAGMTFEVYDKIEGIPPIGSNGLRDDEMPIGKGSIEIVRVNAANSECRIVKTTPGMAITQGDLIANLVFDVNVTFKFVVYGKYDLDRNGIATDADADVVKRLATQWGAKVMDQVNVDTDFVVLGKEPILPNFTKEELDLPENAKKLADAQAESDAYQKVKADARELHIPVLNQNRFLYFVGFYDQSKR